MRSFEEYNPIAVAVYFLATVGIAMFGMNLIITLLSLTGALLLYFIRNSSKEGHLGLSLGISASEIRFVGFTLILFLIMALINPLVSHSGVTVLFVMNDNPITLEAFIYGVAASLMIVSVLYWFNIFSKIMTSDKLLYIFGRLSPKLALIISMALRYVPLFGEQYRKVKQSQKALGLYKEDNMVDSFKGSLRVFSILITWALENGIITADSMAARGYGVGRRSRFSLFRYRQQDILILTLSIILCVLTLFGISGAQFVYYPAILVPKINIRNFAGYLAYGILVLLPTIIEVKEALKWKYLRSKI